MQDYSFASTYLNDFKYYCQTLIILFHIIHFLVEFLMVSSIVNDRLVLLDP